MLHKNVQSCAWCVPNFPFFKCTAPRVRLEFFFGPYLLHRFSGKIRACHWGGRFIFATLVNELCVPEKLRAHLNRSKTNKNSKWKMRNFFGLFGGGVRRQIHQHLSRCVILARNGKVARAPNSAGEGRNKLMERCWSKVAGWAVWDWPDEGCRSNNAVC